MPSDQRFRVREKLRRILQTVGATEKLFTTRQIFTYLGKYIEKNKLHDSRNMHIVRCKGDFLEDLFGVQEFTVESFKDMWEFIFPHIIPATNREVLEHESECQTKESDNTNVGDLQWMSQLPWWYFVDKDSKAIENHDVATVSSSVVATSTVYVVDTDYESDSNISNNPRTDPLEDDRFSIEYEPDSEGDDDSDATEPIDSEDEAQFSSIPLPLPRADYNEDTTTTDTTDVSMDYDIPLEDHWRCNECKTVNPPRVGYCQRCWKLRKGWIDASILPDVGILKSQTLPTEEFTEDFTPSLLRSSSQPNPMKHGIDVTDGKKNKTPTDVDQQESSNSGSNYNELPFNSNSVKRKFDSGEESPSQIRKKTPRNLSDGAASASKLPDPITSRDPSVFPSSDSATVSEDRSSSSSTRQPQFSFSLPGLCNICHNNPNDATIVHGNFGHQYCCSKCAKKLKKKGKSCPVCRQPIEFVVKNFIYQM